MLELVVGAIMHHVCLHSHTIDTDASVILCHRSHTLLSLLFTFSDAAPPLTLGHRPGPLWLLASLEAPPFLHSFTHRGRGGGRRGGRGRGASRKRERRREGEGEGEGEGA